MSWERKKSTIFKFMWLSARSRGTCICKYVPLWMLAWKKGKRKFKTKNLSALRGYINVHVCEGVWLRERKREKRKGTLMLAWLNFCINYFASISVAHLPHPYLLTSGSCRAMSTAKLVRWLQEQVVCVLFVCNSLQPSDDHWPVIERSE